MNDSIFKYLNKSKDNLNVILSNLEANIEFLENDLWNTYDEIKDPLKGIINIYYDKYYLYTSNDYSKINKYIRFNNKINRKLKNILLAIIDYYESINKENNIIEKEGSILYLNILIYIATVLYDKSFDLIDNSKKIEKIINNIIDNFARIRFRRDKDLVLFISNIKNVIVFNNDFLRGINSLNSLESHNVFININKELNCYKVIYEYNIKALNDYDDKDLVIVNNKMNISSVLTKISYDLSYYTVFNFMKMGKNYELLFPISKKDLMNKEVREFIRNREEIITNKIKFLVNYNDIKDDYDFINLIKSEELDVYIEVLNSIETNNYNMFMDIKNIIVTEEFLNINERYLEIWKDMGINFIVKNMGDRLSYEDLLSRK